MPDEVNVEKTISFEDALIAINGMLQEYMRLKSIKLQGHQFSCPDKAAHKNADVHKSAGIFKVRGNVKWRCQGCGAGTDTIAMACIIDGYPSRGPGFFKITVPKLAEELGLGTVIIETNPMKEVYYKVESELQPVKPYFRDIPPEIQKEFGIGMLSYDKAQSTVDSMFQVDETGFGKGNNSMNDVMKRVFSDRVVFSIRDKTGSPISFAGRVYKEDDDRRKWENGMTTSIFSKAQCLYALDLARAHAFEADRLYIVEGYTDTVRMHMHGIKNTVGIMFNQITESQVKEIKNMGISRVVIALDKDPDTSKTKSKTFKSGMSLMEYGLEVLIKSIPVTGHDPDSYILDYGIDAFKDIPEVPMAEYAMYEMISDIKNNDQIKDYMYWIAKNYQSKLIIERTMHRLSEYIKIKFDSIMDDMDNILNNIQRNENVRIKSTLSDMVDDIKNMDVGRALGVMRETITKLSVDVGDKIISPERQAQELESAKQRTIDDNIEILKLGNHRMQEKLFIPQQKGTFVVFAAHSNVGKSSFIRDLCCKMINLNQHNTSFIYYTLDDDKDDVRTGMISNMEQVPLVATRYLSTCQPKERALYTPKIIKGYDTLREWALTRKLSVLDDKDTTNAFMLEAMIKSVKRATGNHVVVFIDSLHSLIDRSLGSISDARVTAMVIAGEIKRISNQTESTIVTIAEFNRTNRNVAKPTIANISESVKIEYLSNIGITFHTDMAQWSWVKHTGMLKETELPIIEMCVEKNKTAFQKGSIYYKFDPEFSSFAEMSVDEQQQYMEKRGIK